MKAIAILGTGPAGLMAAHACVLAGRPFVLFSAPGQDGRAHPSQIGGAQFLHKAVPMLMDADNPDMTLQYVLFGTPERYRNKVYGDNSWVPFVSMENVKNGEEVPAWNLRRLYLAMWEAIAGDGDSVNVERVNALVIQEWLQNEVFHFIVSTIPRNFTCLSHAGINPNPHAFMSQEVVVSVTDYADVAENRIVYNGKDEPSWYRASNIQGVQSVEWGTMGSVPPWMKDKVTTVPKPIVHGCNCWEGNKSLVFAGRYGKWQKGVLVHDGFTTCAQALMDRGLL